MIYPDLRVELRERTSLSSEEQVKKRRNREIKGNMKSGELIRRKKKMCRPSHVASVICMRIERLVPLRNLQATYARLFPLFLVRIDFLNDQRSNAISEATYLSDTLLATLPRRGKSTTRRSSEPTRLIDFYKKSPVNPLSTTAYCDFLRNPDTSLTHLKEPDPRCFDIYQIDVSLFPTTMNQADFRGMIASATPRATSSTSKPRAFGSAPKRQGGEMCVFLPQSRLLRLADS